MGTTATECYAKDGRKCIFPFTYKYNFDPDDPSIFDTEVATDCTLINSFKQWCVVETSGLIGGQDDVLSEQDDPLDYINKWGYCYGSIPPPDDLEFITPAAPNCGSYMLTVDGDTCQFPFTYNGIPYNGCTTINHAGTGGEYWCATNSNFNTPVGSNLGSGFWGKCDISDCPMYRPPETGCRIPTTKPDGSFCATQNSQNGFLYSGILRHTCIIEDSVDGSYWCSTADEYKDVLHYATCALDTEDPLETCVFPFTYRGVTYKGCTTVNHYRPWCAYDSAYQTGRWGNCDMCPKP